MDDLRDELDLEGGDLGGNFALGNFALEMVGLRGGVRRRGVNASDRDRCDPSFRGTFA